MLLVHTGMNEEAGVAFGNALAANRSLELVDLGHCRCACGLSAECARVAFRHSTAYERAPDGLGPAGAIYSTVRRPCPAGRSA